ncbi:zinc finger domain-containing protein [Streptomyces roseoviridis]|uniref:DNA-binding phage zinc finger domain-containing protein n=1 Tax=Streptomyces roseoviridis TaxID=67361 RepID=A0ABV5QZS5_9ACTN
MAQGPRRGGRKGQSYTATPKLRSYDVPPASAVTVTRADGTVEVVPAQKPQATKKPARRRGPLVCAKCGYPIDGKAVRSTESWMKGKPVHPGAACPRQKVKRPTKPDPASTLPRSRGGTAQPYKSPNTRAVKESAWLQVTCPRCGAGPGTRCTVRTPKGTVTGSAVPHQERPQIVRRAMAAAAAQKKAQRTAQLPG